MKFLGTSGAELYPNPFCRCEVCNRARSEGAVPRRRSAFSYDETLCIDFGPDILAAAQQYDVTFDALRDIIITHTHEDHLSIINIEGFGYSSDTAEPIRLHLSPSGVRWVRRYCEQNAGLYGAKCAIERLLDSGKLVLCEFTPYEWQNVGTRRMFAVESNHRGCGADELALNYIIEDNDGGRLMYAVDTGLYSDENIAALSGFMCSTLIIEGTYGNRAISASNTHMNAERVVDTVRSFKDVGILTPDARVYVTHVNQVNTYSHEEYEAYIQKELGDRAFVAYDGMEI